ncbi:MAG: hypothetical protein OHK0022_45080 [Roseiflexaceae bacterium]
MHDTRRTRRKPAEQETPPSWSESTPAPAAPAPTGLVQREAATTEFEQELPEPGLIGHSFGRMSLFAENFDAGAPAAPPGPPAAPSTPLDPPAFPVQASLRISAPDDAFEQEADQMASAVMDMSSDAGDAPASPGLRVQRAASAGDGAGLSTSPAVDASIAQMQGGGQPLPASERSFFENRFGHDFSQIRIHADSHAADTAKSLNARAFTVGTDIAFDAGEYQPGTSSGRHLLAHELTHTIQQTGGVATKRVQRKERDDEADEAETAPEAEEAPTTEQSPADLVAVAQQKLTEDEVNAQPVAPVEAQPVDLPETKAEDESAGGGGGGGAADDAAPAATAKALAEQQVAEAEKAAQTVQTAPGAAAAAPASQPTATPAAAAPAAPVASAPAAQAAVPEATQATAPEAAPAEQKTEQKGETASAAETAPTAPTAAGGEANAPAPPGDAPQSAAAARPEANTADERSQPGQAETETAAGRGKKGPQPASQRAAGVDQQAEASADDEDERTATVQRFPAGRMIQRAPRSPDADPAFQAVTTTVKTTAAEQKQHAPAQQKADEAAAAAKMPQEEKLGAAQNTQATAIDGAAAAQEQAAAGGNAPGFDKAAFKASVKARIDELTPKDPKQMENIEGAGVFGDVKSAVDQKVETGKDQAQGNVDDKVKEAPNPGAVHDKPTTPLQTNNPGTAPGAIDAAGAAPKPHEQAEVETPLQAQSQALDTQMAAAKVTPEQLQHSNEPQFQTAWQAKTDAQAHVTEALPQYRAKEQSQIQGAQAEAGTLAQSGLGAMFQTRTGSFGQMDTVQKGAQSEDEQKRAQIGQQIDGIYQNTKSAVEQILASLDTAVDQCFTSGADQAKQTAIDYIKRETDAYKAKRYNQDADWWRVDQHIAGAATHAWDAITDMPEEYYEYYRQGRDLYVNEMDGVLDQVANIVAEHLKRAKDRVQQGRNEITKFVESQPEELRQVAQEAAQNAQSKFDQLDETVDAKQNEIVDSLAQKYVEKLQALDSELEAMKEAEKGLLAKAGDLIEGVIKTIGELKDLLLNTLQRAAGAVMKILQNPIEFLGNLLSAVGQGLRQFAGNIGTHLQQGLISWLTGALAGGGIQLPASWDLQGIFSLVMQILGLTYAQIRARIVQALGPIGEQVIGALEGAWEVFQIIQSEGLAGLWHFIADQVGDLQAMVMDQIKEMVISQVIRAGIEWLVGILGGPAGAFIKAVQAIVRVVTWFVNNAARLASLVNSVIDSVMAIASGDIGGAASHIEQSLAKALPSVISFLADLLGLGGISQKVQQIITKVRAPIEKAITWLVQKAVALGKKLWGMLTGKRKKKDGPDPRTRDDKQADLGSAIEAAERVMSQSGATPKSVRQQLPGIKNEYGLVSLDLIRKSKGKYVVHGKVNPDEYSDEKILVEEGSEGVNKSKSAAYQAVNEAQALLDENPELKGEFDFAIRGLRKKWDENAELANSNADDEMRKLIIEEFQSILKEAKDVTKSIREKSKGKSGSDPAFVTENRVPRDSETFLAGGDYSRTSIRVKGAVVYRGGDGNYYHRDTLHTGPIAEIEVYDAQGVHIGTKNPVTGEWIGSAVAGRMLRGL